MEHYFDNAATTPVRKEVLEAILPYFTENYGNPSSIYEISKKNKLAVEKARKQVADAINASPELIYFTAGGSESDNWALKGIADSYSQKGKHIITSAIEHHAILHTCEYLETKGYEITYLPVDKNGLVSLTELSSAIRPDTILVSIMFANNEIGTVEPIAEIGALCKEKGVLFHTDAVQAAGHLPIDVQAMNIDMLSISGHKFYGPKGIGAMFIRKGIKIPSFIHGGAQERKRRAGTENVPGIVGIGAAIELAVKEFDTEIPRLTALRNRLIDGILFNIPYARLNGDPEKRLPGNVNISFDFIEGESMLLLLNKEGIYASSGSACTSGSLDPSHVLLAIGLPHEKAHGSLRLTLGRFTTEADVDYVLEKLPPIVARLREMSPLYEEIKTNNSNK